ncbi:MAG TPA: isoprenylcysteine carboxylmethyltransferase family protein [Steroidobacteraceae bacterium]|nr:isoprenylcysteine carboxylmethyltransferase family protein [Steroidobacteraceae bacterium]
MLLSDSTRDARPAAAVTRSATARTPLIANLAAFALFFASLCFFSSSPAGQGALALSLAGGALAVVGAALVLRSRAELGCAWSLLPKADRDTGLVTTGPYRVVRHPIYLGLTLIAAGNAVSFGNGAALLLVALGIVPTFAWRACVEEGELSRAFGETFAAYRRRTKMIIPHLL